MYIYIIALEYLERWARVTQRPAGPRGRQGTVVQVAFPVAGVQVVGDPASGTEPVRPRRALPWADDPGASVEWVDNLL